MQIQMGSLLLGGLVGMIVNSFANNFITRWLNKDSRMAVRFNDAAKEFTAVFLPILNALRYPATEHFIGESTAHEILRRSFVAQKNAMLTFTRALPRGERLRFAAAWKSYCPDDEAETEEIFCEYISDSFEKEQAMRDLAAGRIEALMAFAEFR